MIVKFEILYYEHTCMSVDSGDKGGSRDDEIQLESINWNRDRPFLKHVRYTLSHNRVFGGS